MRLIALTALTMLAFAANSLLNRMALAGGHIGAMDFGTIRLIAGAVMLAGLCLVLRGRLKLGGRHRLTGVLALLVYLYGFSLAYNALDAGLGALVLFGMVQITMFSAAILTRTPLPPRRYAGATLAMAGLAWLMWPGPDAVISPAHGALMALAGVGWGVYSLAGRAATDALQTTAANFTLAMPVTILIWLAIPADTAALPITPTGLMLAILCGAVTSGLGYALWYHVLPQIEPTQAAVTQLSVPVIALLGGVLLLDETLTLRSALASALVLGGVALSLPTKQR